MTQEEIEALREMVYAANNTPINQMSCFVCDHCSVFKKSMECYCNFHHYSLLDAHRNVCFNFRPLRKEQKIIAIPKFSRAEDYVSAMKNLVRQMGHDKQNTVHLVLKRKWWDMIADGRKKGEYREVCHYWAARLLDSRYSWYSRNTDYPHDYVGWLCLKLATKSIAFKNFTQVCFHLGYTNTTMTYRVEDICIIHGSACHKEWGAEESKHYFVIKLGERVE